MRRRHYILMALLLVAGAALRLYFIQAHSAFMQSDEAVVGLMTKHILTRGEFPVFFYGEERSGAVITYLAAPLFALFGCSNLVLKCVAGALSLVLVLLLYFLARSIGGPRQGLLALAPGALAPPFLIMWSVHGAAEYLVMMVCGTAALLVCCLQLFPSRPNDRRHPTWRVQLAYGLIGLLLGVGMWASPLIVSFLIAVFIVLAVRDRQCFLRGACLVAVLGFAAGSLPALLFNVRPDLRAQGGLPNAPNWVSYTSLVSDSPILASIQALPATIVQVGRVSLPILLGGGVWDFDTDLRRRSVALVLVAFWLVALFSLLAGRFLRWLRLAGRSRWALERLDLLLLQSALALLVFCLSQCRWLVCEPRHLIPLLPAFLLAGAHLMDALWSRSRHLASFVLATVLFLNVAGAVWFAPGLDPDHGLWPRDRELARYLVDHEIRHPITDYWIAYALAFQTGEEVIPIPIGYTKLGMYPQVASQPLGTHYIFRKRSPEDAYFSFFRYGLAGRQWSAREFASLLSRLDIPPSKYRTWHFAQYVLFDVPHLYLDPLLVASGSEMLPDEPAVQARRVVARECLPGDALVVSPPSLLAWVLAESHTACRVYVMPDQFPMDARLARERLAAITREHRRVFLLLGDTSETDPQGLVEAWFNGEAFRAADRWIGSLRLVIYGSTVLPPPTQATRLLGIRYGDRIELVGTDLAQAVLRPGDTVLLSLFWEAGKPLTLNYKVFVHLLDPKGDLVSQHDSEPAGGGRSTSGWVTGERVIDRHGLLLPLDLPAGDYRLVVGLYEQESGARLVVSGAGASGDAVTVGVLRIQP